MPLKNFNFHNKLNNGTTWGKMISPGQAAGWHYNTQQQFIEKKACVLMQTNQISHLDINYKKGYKIL